MTTNWRDEVRSWIAWSREKLPTDGDLPAVNCPEFKSAPWMARISDLFELADRPQDESQIDPCQLSALFEEALRPLPNDTPTRFTALSVCYALANHPVPQDSIEIMFDLGPPFNWDDATTQQLARAQDNRARHEQRLEHFVRMRQLEDLGTWKEMRWEILNSYSIGDWARAGKLYDRAEELGLLDKKEILLLRAQFNYLQIFGCIIAECLRFFFRPREFPDSRYGLGSLNWEPRVYERVEGVPIQDQDVGYAGLFLSGIYFSFGDEVFLIPTKHRGLLVGDREMDLEAYFEYYKTELERLHGGHDFGEELSAAVHDLERAIAGSPNPNPAYRSMLAKCYFMVGRYKEAAATYEAVHAAIREGSSLRLWSYMCTAISFQRAGKLDKAVEFLERCSSDFPNEAGIHFHKAKLYDKAGNLDGARESLLKAVELAPHLKNIFGVSLALAANSPDYDAIDSAIERHLNQNPEDARRLESFILSHWPTFTKLARLTENNWRGGVMMLYCMPMRDIILMQTLVTSGAHKLAIAVEVELRTTVFLKFREYVLGRPQLCELAQGVPKENKRLRPFADFLASGEPFALGQMNFVLQTCQKVEDPLFSEFKSWVQREFPSVLGLVSRLYQIKDTRNPLSHDGEAPITPEDFTVFCREILEGIAQRNVPAQAALPVESR